MFAGSIVGVFELRAMLSHLDNWYLMISNSIEINRLVCVTEATSKKSRDHWSLFSVIPSESIFIVFNKYILQTYNCKMNRNRKRCVLTI